MRTFRFALVFLAFTLFIAGCKSFIPVSITLIPNQVELIEGQRVDFSAIGKDSEGILKEVEVDWFLIGDAIGNLTSFEGKRTTLVSNAPGSGQIKAAYNALLNIAPVTVGEMPDINRIEINPSYWKMNVGEVKQFSVVGYTEDDLPIEVIGEWSVSGGIGTIAPSNGKTSQLFSISAGKGSVTVTIGEFTQQAAFEVTQRVLTRIAVAPSSKSLYAGDEVEFSAVGFDQYDKSLPVEVFWSTEGAVGSISQRFGNSTKFTATNIGVGRITASVRDITCSAIIDVMPVLEFVESTPSEAVVYVGQTIEVSAIGGDAWAANSFYDFHWSTTNNNGTLSSTLGSTTKFTATKVGTELVTCSLSGCSDTTSIEILDQHKTITLNGTVENVEYQSTVPGVEVRFYAKSGDLLDVTYTDSLGRWSATFAITLPDKYVIVQAGKEGYFIRTAKILAEDRNDFLIRIVADDLNNFLLFAHEVWGPLLTISRFDHDNFAAFVIDSAGFDPRAPENIMDALLDQERKVGEFIGTWDYDVYIDPTSSIVGNVIYVRFEESCILMPPHAAHWEEVGYARCVSGGSVVYHFSPVYDYSTLLHEIGHITFGHPVIINHSVMSYQRDTGDYSEFDLKGAKIANEDTYIIDVDEGYGLHVGQHEDGETILGTIWGIDHIDSLQNDWYVNSIGDPVIGGTEVEI